MTLVFSSVFEADFAELVAYFQGSSDNSISIRFEDQVCHLTTLLLRHPELGRLRRDLKPEGYDLLESLNSEIICSSIESKVTN